MQTQNDDVKLMLVFFKIPPDDQKTLDCNFDINDGLQLNGIEFCAIDVCVLVLI